MQGVGISAIKSIYQSQLKPTRPDADAYTIGQEHFTLPHSEALPEKELGIQRHLPSLGSG